MSEQTVTGYVALPNQPPMMRTLGEALKLNTPTLDFSGGKVRIAALVDLDGLAQLESSLAALRVLMRPKSADEPKPFPWRSHASERAG